MKSLTKYEIAIYIKLICMIIPCYGGESFNWQIKTRSKTINNGKINKNSHYTADQKIKNVSLYFDNFKNGFFDEEKNNNLISSNINRNEIKKQNKIKNTYSERLQKKIKNITNYYDNLMFFLNDEYQPWMTKNVPKHKYKMKKTYRNIITNKKHLRIQAQIIEKIINHEKKFEELKPEDEIVKCFLENLTEFINEFDENGNMINELRKKLFVSEPINHETKKKYEHEYNKMLQIRKIYTIDLFNLSFKRHMYILETIIPEFYYIYDIICSSWYHNDMDDIKTINLILILGQIEYQCIILYNQKQKNTDAVESINFKNIKILPDIVYIIRSNFLKILEHISIYEPKKKKKAIFTLEVEKYRDFLDIISKYKEPESRFNAIKVKECDKNYKQHEKTDDDSDKNKITESVEKIINDKNDWRKIPEYKNHAFLFISTIFLRVYKNIKLESKLENYFNYFCNVFNVYECKNFDYEMYHSLLIDIYEITFSILKYFEETFYRYHFGTNYSILYESIENVKILYFSYVEKKKNYTKEYILQEYLKILYKFNEKHIIICSIKNIK